MLGKSVTDLQTGIEVSNDSIGGTLKYVTGYTGFSGDPALQSGNYLALHITAETGAVIKVQLIGETTKEVTLDADGLLVARIANNEQKIRVIATKGGVSATDTFDLTALVLEDE